MPRPDQASRIVRERDQRWLRAMRLALGLSICLMGGALGVVGLKVEQVQLSYRLEALRAAKVELDELNRRLRVELATLRSLSRIEGKALAELGMVPPVRHQVQMAREFVTAGDGAASLRTARETQVPDGLRLQ